MADKLEKALTFLRKTNILHHYKGILLLKLLWQNQNYQLVLCGSQDWSLRINLTDSHPNLVVNSVVLSHIISHWFPPTSSVTGPLPYHQSLVLSYIISHWSSPTSSQSLVLSHIITVTGPLPHHHCHWSPPTSSQSLVPSHIITVTGPCLRHHSHWSAPISSQSLVPSQSLQSLVPSYIFAVTGPLPHHQSQIFILTDLWRKKRKTKLIFIDQIWVIHVNNLNAFSL